MVKSLLCRLAVHLHWEEYGALTAGCDRPGCGACKPRNVNERTCLDCGYVWCVEPELGYNPPPRHAQLPPEASE